MSRSQTSSLVKGMIITDEMIDAAAAAIEEAYVERGVFSDDEFRAVTEDDRHAAKKGLEAALAASKVA